jgi:hypothetical protein
LFFRESASESTYQWKGKRSRKVENRNSDQPAKVIDV